MLTRQIVSVLTVVMGAGLAFGGCGGGSSSGTGGSGGGTGGAGGASNPDAAAGGSGGATGGSGGATGGSGGATGGSGGATGGSGGATGGAGGTGGTGGAGGRTVFKCGGGGNRPNSCTQAEINAHNMCVGSKCLDAYSQCLGAAFKDTGQIGGVCGPWFTCFNACNCGDIQCWGACGMPPAECSTCLENAGKCSETMCPEPECMKPKLDGGAGGASCDDLKKCCDAIADANTKAACNAQAGSGNAGTCSSTLAAFKAGGLCP